MGQRRDLNPAVSMHEPVQDPPPSSTGRVGSDRINLTQIGLG